MNKKADSNDIGNYILGGTGVATGLLGGKLRHDADKIIKGFDKWVADTKAVQNRVGRQGEFVSPVTGNRLQVSPEAADELFNAYTRGAGELARSTVLGVPAGSIVGTARTIPILATGGSADAASDMAGHYRMFQDRSLSPGTLASHMITNVMPPNGTDLDPKYTEGMRKALAELSPDLRKILDGGDSITGKYKAFQALGESGRPGLDFMEKFVLGNAKGPDPGAARFVGGGEVAGSLMPGIMRKYFHGTKTPLGVLRGVGTASAGAGAGLTALALIDALSGKAVGVADRVKGLSKAGSYTPDGDNYAERGAEAALSGILGAAGVGKARRNTAQLMDRMLYGPNMNVGFTYGALEGIGDGHKTPAKHIRQVLEAAADRLPEGHPLKDRINFIDVPNLPGGFSPNVAKDFNILYNTGLGAHGAAFTPSTENVPYGTNALPYIRGKAQSVRSYMTDTPHSAAGFPSFGAAVQSPLSNYPGADDYRTVAYGHIPEAHRALHATPAISGSLMNVGEDIIGTPFINPDFIERAGKYPTREARLGRLRDIAGSLSKDPATEAQGRKLAEILDSVAGGKKLVTIAGSGRGDYVINRLAHVLDSATRAGLDNVVVTPLLGGYSGLKTVSPKDVNDIVGLLEGADPRVKGFGRLQNEAYTLLQQIADANMASTGQMAVSEAANNGNLEYIPRRWGDMNHWHNPAKPKPFESADSSVLWTKPGLVDLLRKTRGNPGLSVEDIAPGIAEKPWLYGVELDSWNRGSMDQFPDRMPDVFKRIESYDGDLRPGVADYLRRIGLSDDVINTIGKHQRFDTDPMVELLKPENAGKLSEMTAKAMEASKANMAKIPGAQKVLADDMFATLARNATRQRLAPVPGAIGGAAMTGLGAAGLFDALFAKSKGLNSLLAGLAGK